jgi:hypothetical protein
MKAVHLGLTGTMEGPKSSEKEHIYKSSFSEVLNVLLWRARDFFWSLKSFRKAFKNQK